MIVVLSLLLILSALADTAHNGDEGLQEPQLSQHVHEILSYLARDSVKEGNYVVASAMEHGKARLPRLADNKLFHDKFPHYFHTALARLRAGLAAAAKDPDTQQRVQ
jgi:hypothetical protein